MAGVKRLSSSFVPPFLLKLAILKFSEAQFQISSKSRFSHCLLMSYIFDKHIQRVQVAVRILIVSGDLKSPNRKERSDTGGYKFRLFVYDNSFVLD